MMFSPSQFKGGAVGACVAWAVPGQARGAAARPAWAASSAGDWCEVDDKCLAAGCRVLGAQGAKVVTQAGRGPGKVCAGVLALAGRRRVVHVFAPAGQCHEFAHTLN